MANPAHVHEANDGRGPRDVYLNGRLIGDVVYANERSGKVRVIARDGRGKFRIHKRGKRVIRRTLRGAVRVVPHA